jgi:predicted Zn-dependent protease
VAALCAAGVVAGVVTYRSEERTEEAFSATFDRKSLDEIDRLFDQSEPLNPGAAREVALARMSYLRGEPERAEEFLRQAADLEPHNIRVWHLGTRIALGRRDRATAERRWARARELDPQLPAALPPPL